MESERESYLVPVSLSAHEADTWIQVAKSFGFDGNLPSGILVEGSPAFRRKAIAFAVQHFMQEASGGMMGAPFTQG